MACPALVTGLIPRNDYCRLRTKRRRTRPCPRKTAAAFLAGALVASTGTAAALTQGHVFRLQEGDHAKYGTIDCQAEHVAQYSILDCVGAQGYRLIYGPSELRVLCLNDHHVYRQVFAAKPYGR
jgi:hypothetical protein